MKRFTKSLFTSGSVLVICIMISNFFNYVFNSFIGRNVSFDDFGLYSLFNSFWALFSIFLVPLGATVANRVSYLDGSDGKLASRAFYVQTMRKLHIPIAAIVILWLAASPPLHQFFKLPSVWALALFAPVMTVSLYTSMMKGFLNGRLDFARVGFLFLLEAASRLGFGILLVTLGHPQLLYLAIVGSVSVWGLATYYFVHIREGREHQAHVNYPFPKRFFIAAFVAGLCTNAFMSFDVLLAKHYLTPYDAGRYAFLSLVGKMVFFFGSTLQIFIIPLVSKNEGAHKQSSRVFLATVGSSVVLTAIMVIAIGHFGYITMPILFGSKVNNIAPYLVLYAYAMGFFTVANAIIQFHLAKHQYAFSVVGFLAAVIMSFVIMTHHSSIQEIATVLMYTTSTLLAITVLLHFIQKESSFFIRSLIDLISLFSPIPQHTNPGKKRILVFSWRDMRHRFAGGSELFVHELAKRWVARGASVTLFCGNDGTSPRYEEIDGISIVRRGGFYMVYVWAFVYYIFRFRGRFDIIFDVENGVPFFTPLYAREKIYLVIHHVHQDVFRRSLHPVLAAYATFMEMHVMPYVYRTIQVLTISPSTKRDIEKANLSTVEPKIVYCGVAQGSEPGEKSKKPLFVYVGRLKYYKSVNVFIKASLEVKKQHPDARFIVAGEGEHDLSLHAYAKRVHAPVEFVGRVTEEEKIHLYQQAWATVNPSAMEGWGITSIESNKCGTPILASDVPGLRDSVKDGYSGFLFPYANHEALAALMNRIIDEPALREQMKQQTLDWSSQFDWDRSADMLYELFEQES